MKSLVKNLMYSNPVFYKSLWLCYCDIFANNKVDFYIDDEDIKSSFTVFSEPVFNSTHVESLKFIMDENPTPLNILKYRFELNQSKFIKENIDVLVDYKLMDLFSDIKVNDFSLDDNSLIWKISKDMNPDVVFAATLFLSNASHVLFSTYFNKIHSFLNKGEYKDVQFWSSPEYFNIFMKIKEKEKELSNV